MSEQRHIKVRAEEVAIGALVGVGTALAVTAPITLGMPGFIPSPSGSLWAMAQAGVFWLAAVVGAGAGGYWAARQERDSHVRGARYIPTYRDARKALQVGQTEQFSGQQRKHEIQGINIGGVELARAQETRHIVAVGTTGSGKTALLTSVIDQILARGDRVLIHDPKGDFTAKYYDPQTCVLLGPWDARASLWDAAADIATPALADEFGSATAGKVEGQDKSFFDNAGRVIAGLVKSYMTAGEAWTWADLAADLAADPFAMVAKAAQGDPGVMSAVPSAFRDDDNPRLSNGDTSTLSIVSSATRWIANYAAVDNPEAPRFSIVKWLLGEAHEEKRIVILNSNAQYEAAARAIFGAVLNSAVATINSAQMPERSSDSSGLWCILDELPQVGQSAMSALQKIYELGRSRGIRAVLALQDESQLAAAMESRDKAAPMLAVQGARVYMQCSAQTADEVSRRVGEREIHRIETTSEAGAVSGKTRKLVTQRVIQPSDLSGLHPRIAERPLGVELILHIGDSLGRLLHPFAPRRPDKAPALVESEAWKYGVLPQRQQPPQTDSDDSDALPLDDDDLPGFVDDGAGDEDDSEAPDDNDSDDALIDL